MNNVIGKYIIVIGLFIIIIGVLIYFYGDKLTWIGRLPGDIKISRGNLKIFLPLTTMILISVLLTLLLNLFKKLF